MHYTRGINSIRGDLMKALLGALVLLFTCGRAQAGSYCDGIYKNKKSREGVVCSFIESMGYITRFTVDNICPFACSQRHVMVMMRHLDNAGFAVDPIAESGCGTRWIAANLYKLGDVSLEQAVDYVAEASKKPVEECE